MLKKSVSLLVFIFGLAAVIGIVLGGLPAQAQTTYYWTTTPGAMTAGSGTMDTATPNWSTTTTGDGTLQAWSGGSADTADFYANSSPTSTITVNGNQNVGTITFDGSGYTLTGGTLALAGAITANQNAEIDSVLSGTNLTKLGSGLLTLGGANAFSGSFTIGSSSAPAGVGYPMGTSPNPSSGVIVGNAAALQNAAVYIYSVDVNTRGQGVVFGPGVASGTFGSLASYGAGPLSLMTTDATPQPVSLTVGGNNASTTFNGVIWSYSPTGITTLSQAGTLVKTGNGTFTLNDGNGNDYRSWEPGAQAYQGVYALVIAGGEVMLTGIRQLPGCDNPATSPGTPGAVTFSGGILGINFVDTNGWDLNAINNDINGTNFNGGFDIVQSAMSLPLFTQLTGTGSFTKLGAGALILEGGNSYTGGTTLSAGLLQLVGGAALGGGGPLTVNGGELDLNGSSYTVSALGGVAGTITNGGENSVTLTLSLTGGSTTFSGRIQDGANPIGLVINGNGTEVLAGVNAYGGGTTLDGGELSVSAEANLGNFSGGSLTFNGGTLQITGTTMHSTLRSIAWGAAGGGFDIQNAANTFTVTQNLGGVGPLSKSGAGTLVLSGNNSYTGGTTVSGGSLQMGNLSALGGSGGSSGPLTVNGGTLDLNGFSPTVSALSGAPGGTITNSSPAANATSTLTVDQSGTTAFGGSLADGAANQVALSISGTGALILGGNSTYTGSTTVSAGTLSVAGALLNTSAVAVNGGLMSVAGMVNASAAAVNGGMMSVAGTLGGGPVTISAGTLQIGNGGSGESLASPTVSDNGALIFDHADALTYAGSISGAGSVTKLGSGLLTLSGANAFSGTFTVGSPSAVAGVGVPVGTNPGPSGGIIIGNGAALQNSAVYLCTNGLDTWSRGVVFGPGVTSGTFGSLASYGFGPFSLTTIDSTPLPVSLTVGGNNASTTFNGAIWSYDPTGAINSLSKAGTLVKVGNGVLTLTDGGSNDYWSYEPGSHYYQGYYSLVLASGEVTLTSIREVPGRDAPVGPAQGSIVFSGGILGVSFNGDNNDKNALSTAIQGTNFNGGFDISASAGVPSSTPGSVQLSTQLSGTGSLTKLGPGTLVLQANNTLSGTTTVANGLLAVNGSLLSTGSVAVQGGALGGTGNVGAVHVYNGGALAPGYTAGAGTLTAASVSLDGGSALDYTLVSPSSSGNSFLNVAGTLTLPTVGVTTLDVAGGGSLGPGTYPLIAYGSLSGGGTGALSLGFSLPAGDTSTFAISSTSNVIDLVISAPALINGQWGVNSGGTWSTATNWSGGNVPGVNAEDTAVFGTVLTSGTANVVLDGSRSLSSLGFSTTGTNSYVISASNGSTLTLSNTGGAAATISDSGGNHTIAAPVTLGSNLSVTAVGGSTLTISGAIGAGGSQTLGVSGGGTLILSGNNTYSGATTVNAGTLQVGSGGSGEGLTSSITMSNNATVAFNHADPLSYGGAISGSGQLVKLGTGVLDLSGTSTYSGPTTISAGTVELDGNGNNLPTATALTIASGGVLDLAGVPQTVGSLSGSAGAIVMNHYSPAYSSTLTVAPSSGSTTFAGNIIGNDALALSGSGELTLSGTNTYTGGTTVSGGTLDIAAPSALAGSGLVTIAAGGRLVLGSGAGIGALLAASSPASAGAVALSAASAPATIGEYWSGPGNMAALSGAPALSQGGGGSAVGGTAAAVPEPATIALLVVGVVGLIGWARRRRKDYGGLGNPTRAPAQTSIT